MRTILLAIFILGFFSACNVTDPQPKTDLLAEVFDRKLYKSDLQDQFSIEEINKKTPSINVFVEEWVRDQLILHEAEKKIETSLEIENLVENYRNNLVKLEFERAILNEKMSLDISPEELQKAYDSDKLIYALKEELFKANFIQIDKKDPKVVEIRKLWRADNWGRLENYCNKNGITSFFKSKTWQGRRELNSLVPIDIMTSRKLKKNLKFEASIDNAEYFLKIWDFKDKNEEPPLEYIREQLSSVILHRRRIKLINKMTEEFYEKALKRNNIKVY